MGNLRPRHRFGAKACEIGEILAGFFALATDDEIDKRGDKQRGQNPRRCQCRQRGASTKEDCRYGHGVPKRSVVRSKRSVPSVVLRTRGAANWALAKWPERSKRPINSAAACEDPCRWSFIPLSETSSTQVPSGRTSTRLANVSTKSGARRFSAT